MIDNTRLGSMPKIEYYKAAGIDMVRIPYEIEEVSPGIFSWRELSVRYTNFNYGGLVSELVGLEYSDAQMTAIINNYLLDPEDEDAKKEFIEMQNLRKQAKVIAKKIVANK